jgi:WD40 repeat protein
MLDFPKTRVLSPKPSWTGSFNNYITAIAWSNKSNKSNESEYLAIATAEGEVHLGSLSGSKQSRLLQSANSESVDCLSFWENWLAAAGQAGKINLWNLAKNLTKSLGDLPDQPTMSIDQGGAWVDFLVWQCLGLSPKIAFSLGKYVQVWSAENQDSELLDIITTVNFENSSVQALAWHPEGKYLTVGGYQGIKIWNARDWDQDPFTLPIPTAIGAIAWHPQGKCLVIATADGTVIFLDYKSGEFTLSPFQLRGFPSKIKAIAWADSNNSDTFALASGAEISVWQPHPNPNNGWEAEIFNQHSSNVNALEFQPHTRILASGGKDAKLRLSKGAIVLQTLNVPAEITCLQWHPQGHKLAVGTDQGEVLVWNVVEKSPSKSTGSKGFWK